MTLRVGRTHSVDGTKRFKLLSLKGPVGVRHEDIWQRCTRYCVRGDKASSLRPRWTEEGERGSTAMTVQSQDMARSAGIAIGQHCHVTQQLNLESISRFGLRVDLRLRVDSSCARRVESIAYGQRLEHARRDVAKRCHRTQHVSCPRESPGQAGPLRRLRCVMARSPCLVPRLRTSRHAMYPSPPST
jgi:hypothetical protein